MIIRNGKQVEEIFHGTLPLTEVYHRKYLIWQAARSCFGSGYWINDRPWLNEDAWRNE